MFNFGPWGKNFVSQWYRSLKRGSPFRDVEKIEFPGTSMISQDQNPKSKKKPPNQLTHRGIFLPKESSNSRGPPANGAL